MLTHIKKISPQVCLLALSLLTIAGLDVLFVTAYEQPILLPDQKSMHSNLNNADFVIAEVKPSEEAKPFTTEKVTDTTEKVTDTTEEFANHIQQFSTEFTPIALNIPLQTKVKLAPIALQEGTKPDKTDASSDEKNPVGKKKKPLPKLTRQPENAAQHRICTHEALTTAVNVRSIQSKLMVAALSCPGARRRYNRFALKYSRPLQLNADVIMNYLKCKVGQEALLQFDKTITNMANVAAALNSKKHDDFCDDAAGIFDELEEAEAKDLVNVTRRHFYLDDDFLEK